MAIRYVDSNTIMDLGEKIRFKSKVEPVCGVDIPFSIISADYELIFVDTDVVPHAGTWIEILAMK